MNFGFDIDGTISAAPEAFGAIMRALVSAGETVHVITGGLHDEEPTQEQVQSRIDQLAEMGIISGSHYTMLHVLNGPTTGRVASLKQKVCVEFGMVLMFEDSQVYVDAISRVTQCLMMVPR